MNGAKQASFHQLRLIGFVDDKREKQRIGEKNRFGETEHNEGEIDSGNEWGMIFFHSNNLDFSSKQFLY